MSKRQEFWLPAACATAVLVAGCAGTGRQPDSLGQSALLASACSGCHVGRRSVAAMNDGPASGIPDIAGYSAQRLEALLQNYRRQSDGPSAMHRLARGYSDNELRLIAAYLGRQSEEPL